MFVLYVILYLGLIIFSFLKIDWAVYFIICMLLTLFIVNLFFEFRMKRATFIGTGNSDHYTNIKDIQFLKAPKTYYFLFSIHALIAVLLVVQLFIMSVYLGVGIILIIWFQSVYHLFYDLSKRH